MFASVVLLFCADMQEMPMVYAISAMMIRLVICETVDDVEFCNRVAVAAGSFTKRSEMPCGQVRVCVGIIISSRVGRAVLR